MVERKKKGSGLVQSQIRFAPFVAAKLRAAPTHLPAHGRGPKLITGRTVVAKANVMLYPGLVSPLLKDWLELHVYYCTQKWAV